MMSWSRLLKALDKGMQKAVKHRESNCLALPSSFRSYGAIRDFGDDSGDGRNAMRRVDIGS
jgi:hypothetical protein